MSTGALAATAPAVAEHVPGSAGSALECVGIGKSFGATCALADVTLSIAAGEMVALLGPNGAGKSTLFQVLTGLFSPDAGAVRVLGVDMQREPARALAGLGIVFQQSTLDLNLTVRANLHFHADLHGLARPLARERVAALLGHFGLQDVADRPARSLSGGNRRKVELLRALLHAPRLLLMDEATVGLDPASRAQLLEEVLRRTRCERLAVLWATHLVEEADKASRVVVLHRGQVRFDGAPGLLRQAHGASTLEAAFLAITAGASA